MSRKKRQNKLRTTTISPSKTRETDLPTSRSNKSFISKSKLQVQTVGETVAASFRSKVIGLSKLWREGLTGIASVILTSIISISLGLNPFPTTVPLIDFIRIHPIGSIVIGIVLLIISIISLPIWPYTESSRRNRRKNWYKMRWFFSTGLPIGGYVLFSLLLITILAQPTWCPKQICPSAKFFPITNPQGNHDRNLEIYFITIQTPSYMLPRNPTDYITQTLPRSENPDSIGAQRIDKPISYPYRLVFSVHNLNSGRFSILIEQVTFSVKQLPITPNPLNVWVQSPTLTYDSNVYQVIYRGQPTGAMLSATYIHSPNLHVQLESGETDTFDLEVNSTVPAFIQFQIQIQYRIANESEIHKLILPGIFEVVFAENYNWHPYQLENGKLFMET